MITERDPTPEDLHRFARTFRFNAVSNAIFAMVFIVLGVIGIGRRHREFYDYMQFVLGGAWLIMAYFNWRRWRKHAH